MINTQKIKAKMTEKKITQVQLAKLLGIDPSTLNRKINNKNGDNLTVKEVQKIMNILDINNPTEYFFI
ncbi:helix-turn-helix domain-containing protein [Clostridium sp. HCP1S3_B4]|uniref:helix-turn-helix domain-containing protein n=1 Tax=Clostridia TaxID=186801 RepID=UPI002A9100F9|nr:helix-turn-helix transcriptional regulator [Terrisporobacter sp.]MDY6153088.1 helix-turn-helix transcriptional regulator [Terrisporobacter sp.]